MQIISQSMKERMPRMRMDFLFFYIWYLNIFQSKVKLLNKRNAVTCFLFIYSFLFSFTPSSLHWVPTFYFITYVFSTATLSGRSQGSQFSSLAFLLHELVFTFYLFNNEYDTREFDCLQLSLTFLLQIKKKCVKWLTGGQSQFLGQIENEYNVRPEDTCSLSRCYPLYLTTSTH